MAALAEECDRLVSQHDGAEDWPAEVEARLDEIEAALAAFGDGTAYDPEDIARGGVFVILGQDGVARIERGLIRPEDMPVAEPEPDPDAGAGEGDAAPQGDTEAPDDDEGAGPLSERLALDLMAKRAMALRDALGAHPDVALTAVAHALACAAFYPVSGRAACLEIRLTSAFLGSHAPGVEDTRAGRAVQARHERWAVRLPAEAADLWAFVAGLSATELLDLLAHCASLTVNAVATMFDRKPAAMAQADRLAEAVGLDMSGYWQATVGSYLGRVTKAKIAEAVEEGVSADTAERISTLKKPEMAAQAEQLLAGKGWLPSLLRPPSPPPEGHLEAAPLSQAAA